jgi:hypothetical protein
MVKQLALNCSIVEKIPQAEENDKRAQECINILFKPAKTEHYGSFQCSEYGTRKITYWNHMKI